MRFTLTYKPEYQCDEPGDNSGVYVQVEEVERLKTSNAALMAALAKIAYEPFGPSDATHAEVLDTIIALARYTFAEAKLAERIA